MPHPPRRTSSYPTPTTCQAPGAPCGVRGSCRRARLSVPPARATAGIARTGNAGADARRTELRQRPHMVAFQPPLGFAGPPRFTDELAATQMRPLEIALRSLAAIHRPTGADGGSATFVLRPSGAILRPQRSVLRPVR